MDLATIAAVAVLAAGVVAVTARDGRLVILGLTVAAVAAPFVASPLPGSLAISARILGALAAGAVMWVAVETGRIGSSGTAAGPVAEVAAGAAAFAVGLGIRPVDPLAGPLAAQAGGLALVALAVVPLVGRDVFRLGAGIVLLTIGCSLLLSAWSGSMLPLQHLAIAALTVGVAGATCLLAPALSAPLATEAEAAPGPFGLPGLSERQPMPAGPRTQPVQPATAVGRPAAPVETPTLPGPRLPAPRPGPFPLAPRGPLAPEPHPESRPEPAPAPEPAATSEPAAPPESRPRLWTPEPAEDEWAAWAAWTPPEPEPKSAQRPDKKRPGGEDGGS